MRSLKITLPDKKCDGESETDEGEENSESEASLTDDELFEGRINGAYCSLFKIICVESPAQRSIFVGVDESTADANAPVTDNATDFFMVYRSSMWIPLLPD